MDNGFRPKTRDKIRMTRQGLISLQIYPPKFQTRSVKEDATIEINIDEETSSIVRKLISLYFWDSKQFM